MRITAYDKNGNIIVEGFEPRKIRIDVDPAGEVIDTGVYLEVRGGVLTIVGSEQDMACVNVSFREAHEQETKIILDGSKCKKQDAVAVQAQQ